MDEILSKIKYNFDTGIAPLKASIEHYNKERICNDHSYNYLKESSQRCENMLSTSIKLINMIRVLNSGKYLDNLKSIDDVYHVPSNLVEEVLYYHQLKKASGNANLTTTDLDEESLEFYNNAMPNANIAEQPAIAD